MARFSNKEGIANSEPTTEDDVREQLLEEKRKAELEKMAWELYNSGEFEEAALVDPREYPIIPKPPAEKTRIKAVTDKTNLFSSEPPTEKITYRTQQDKNIAQDRKSRHKRLLIKWNHQCASWFPSHKGLEDEN